MAIYIKITKIKEIDNVHYYEVDTDDFKYTKPLTVGLDEKKKKLYFFVKNDLENPTYIIDLNNLPSTLKHEHIPFNLLHSVIKKMKQAAEKEKYDQFLDYAA